ncbi:MAG: hypothetical protein WC796_06310 [Candidatus Pacearchaeota archaeon]|jgi:hypothetical protein
MSVFLVKFVRKPGNQAFEVAQLEDLFKDHEEEPIGEHIAHRIFINVPEDKLQLLVEPETPDTSDERKMLKEACIYLDLPVEPDYYERSFIVLEVIPPNQGFLSMLTRRPYRYVEKRPTKRGLGEVVSFEEARNERGSWDRRTYNI